MDDHGRVVGTATAPDGNDHAFLWTRGHMTDLGTPPGAYSSEALKISSHGHVLGSSVSDTVDQRGFLWWCDTFVTLGATAPYPVDVNSRGEVITNTTLPTGEQRALLWTITHR